LWSCRAVGWLCVYVRVRAFIRFQKKWHVTQKINNMVWIITSIKSNKPSFPTTAYIHPLVSLLPISIAEVSLYSAYLCVSVCVCFCLCVIIVFFSHYRVDLFSSLNLLVTYSLLVNGGSSWSYLGQVSRSRSYLKAQGEKRKMVLFRPKVRLGLLAPAFVTSY